MHSILRAAIKPGRYSHEKKASNIKEVKALLAQIEHDAKFSKTESAPSRVVLQGNPQGKPEVIGDPCLDYGSDRSLVEQYNRLNGDTGSDLNSCVTPGSLEQDSGCASLEQSPLNSINIDGRNSGCNFSSKSNVASNSINSDGRNSVCNFSSQADFAFKYTATHNMLYDLSKVELYEKIINEMHEKHKIWVNEDVELGDTLSEPENECLVSCLHFFIRLL